MTIRKLPVFLAMLGLLGISNSAVNAGAPSAIEPEAARILRQMSDYLGSLKQFTFRAENTADLVMATGQQLQAGGNIDVAIRRPDRFRVNRRGDLGGDQEFYFDGQTLTLYGKSVNYYAKMKASKAIDIDTALEFARDEVGVVTPASDLFYQNAYAGLMEDVESGMLVGTSTVGGAEVHHLAFRGSEVDWQVWIEKGDKPLPRKYLINSKWTTGAPQFSAVFSDWTTSVTLDDALFNFTPPPGAEEIGFIPLRGGTAPGAGGPQ